MNSYINLNRKICILFFCTIISNCVIGQQETEKKSIKFIEFGPSLQYMNLNNPRHSIVQYNGYTYSINLGFQIEKPIKREGIYFTYAKGELSSQNNLNTTGIFALASGYFHERKVIGLSETANWYLGGDLSVFFNTYSNESLGNNQFFYDFAQDLRISTSVRKELSWRKRPVYIEYRLKLPFIAIISRPPKAYFVKDSETEDVIFTSDQLSKNIFTNGKISFVGRYSNIQSDITIWRPFKNNMNRIGLAYVWNLYTYKDYYNKKQVSGIHSLKFILLTNI